MNTKEYYFEYLKRTNRFPQSIYHRAKHNMVQKMFDSIATGSLALDAGCGVGNITTKYCNKYSIVGIDEQLLSIQFCHNFHSGKYIQASLYNIPFADNSFDLVLFLDAIEHFTQPIMALKELARVLKPDANILICTMNYASPLWTILGNTWHRLLGGSCKPYSKDVHPTQYTSEILRQHCSEVFEEVYLQKGVMNMELFFLGKKHKIYE